MAAQAASLTVQFVDLEISNGIESAKLGTKVTSATFIRVDEGNLSSGKVVFFLYAGIQ
jgi:hypothetical protein